MAERFVSTNTPAKTKKRGIARAYEKMHQEMAEYNEAHPEPDYKPLTWNELQTLRKQTNGKYNDQMPARAFELLSDPQICYTKDVVAQRLGINRQTFYEWYEKHPEFQEAVDAGVRSQEARYATRMANGFKFAQGLIFTMKNLHGWADKMEQTHTMQLGKALQGAAEEGKAVQWADMESAPVLSVVDMPLKGDSDRDEAEEPDEGDAEERDE